jgi:hypothetical protein
MNSEINPSERLLRNLKFGDITREGFQLESEAIQFLAQVRKLMTFKDANEQAFVRSTGDYVTPWAVWYYIAQPAERAIERDEKPKSLGFDVRIKFRSGNDRVYHNITEIHYNYDSPAREVLGTQIAFESSVHGNGYTFAFSDVLEFEALIATEKHSCL